MNKSVLVTGGAGYIGSHVCKALKKAGFLPVAYDNMSHGHLWAVQWGPLVKKDIRDRQALKETIAAFKPIAVIHLASYINVRDSMAQPLKYYDNNVAATLTLLETLCEEGVKHFVFSSSAAVYGTPQTLPLNESHPKAPLNVYGKSKDIIEEVLTDLYGAKGLLSAALRYFNAAGADPEGEIGEAHDPETHLIPLTILTALKKRPVLQLNGTDYPTKDGTAVRDFIHVSDLAEAHLLALQALLEGKKPLTLNLGTGEGYSIREVIGAVEKVLNCTIPVELCPRAAGDVPTLVAGVHKAKEILGWVAKFSDLSTIVATAAQWHKKW